MNIKLAIAAILLTGLAAAGCNARSGDVQPAAGRRSLNTADNSIYTDDRCRFDSGTTDRVVISFHGLAGFNPYHAVFRKGGAIYGDAEPAAVTPAVLAEFGITESEIIDVTITGNPEADFFADQALWTSLKPNVHYWFRGTNVIALSLVPKQRVILPDDETSTALSSTNPAELALPPIAAALSANPEAVILVIQGETSDTGGFTVGAEGIQVAPDVLQPELAHPASDIAVLEDSQGYEFLAIRGAHTGSYRFVTECGRIFVGSVPGEDPERRTTVQTAAGPWWSIAVGGFEEGSTNGRRSSEGNGVDFVAKSTLEAPVCARCQQDTALLSNVGVALGHSAGVISRVLLEARRKSGHAGGVKLTPAGPALVAGPDRSVDVWQLRRALELAAAVPSMSDFDATAGNATRPAVPVNDSAPWQSIGWGLLSADADRGVVDEALSQLGFGAPQRAKMPEFCTWQTWFMQERQLFWDQLYPGSPTFGGSVNSPYISC